MHYAKTEREKLGRLTEGLNGIVNRCKREGNRGLTSAERTQFHAMEEDYTRLEELIAAKEQGSPGGFSGARLMMPGGLEEIQDTFRLSPGERREKLKDPHAKAFTNYLRVGMGALSDDDRALMRNKFVSNGGDGILNAQSTTTGSQGGYVVPQGFSDRLEEAMKWFGGIDGCTGEFTTETGNPWPYPTVNDTTNMGHIIGQNVQVTETDFVFNQITFNAYIGSSDLVLIPLALMEDSYFDMDALVARLLGTRLGRLRNHYSTVGTGSAQPMGIVVAAVASGNTYTFPVGETAAISYNDLVNLEHTIDPAYRYNPSTYFMFADAQLKLIKKLVDGNNRPLWQPGLAASFRDGAAVDLLAAKPTILNHPYIINQDMASPAANADSILFGDMSKFMVRKLRGGVTVLRLVERYADYLQVGFLGFFRWDSQLVDAGTHPIAVGINSAT